MLEKISQCLKPIEIAISVLSRIDATLLTAEGVYEFLIDQLEKISSISYSRKLKSVVKLRFNERRQHDIVNFHRFLLNPTPQTNNSTISSKHALVSTAIRLILRIFLNEIFKDCELLDAGKNSEQTSLEQENSCETLPNSQLKQVTDIMLDDLESAINYYKWQISKPEEFVSYVKK